MQRAVLISEKHDGTLVARRVTEVHNGGNERELDRVRREHLGEEECVLNARVLGFLAPTRGTSTQLIVTSARLFAGGLTLSPYGGPVLSLFVLSHM